MTWKNEWNRVPPQSLTWQEKYLAREKLAGDMSHHWKIFVWDLKRELPAFSILIRGDERLAVKEFHKTCGNVLLNSLSRVELSCEGPGADMHNTRHRTFYQLSSEHRVSKCAFCEKPGNFVLGGITDVVANSNSFCIEHIAEILKG